VQRRPTAAARSTRSAPRASADAARRAAGEEDPKLKRAVFREARRLGATVIGFAPVARWAEHGEIPPAYRPEAIWRQARTVVAFGVPMLFPVVESTPSINYQEMYDTSNRLLDEIGYRLAVWLTERGVASCFLPRDGYANLEVLFRNPFASFSHTYAAKYAGLGTVGLSRNLLVPGWGPRIRLGSIFTAAALPGDPVLTVNLCTPCGVCEETCPAGAIREKPGQILGHLDKDACTAHHVALKQEGRWPCGICVKACPIGADRVLFEARGAKRHLEERPALHANPTDARYRHLVHLRTHGSGGIRIL